MKFCFHHVNAIWKFHGGNGRDCFDYIGLTTRKESLDPLVA